MKKSDLQSKLNRFVSFFKPSKSEILDDTLSTRTGGAKMQRRGQASDTSQFEDYLQNIPKGEVVRLKSKKGTTSRTVINNNVNMELIQKCYRNIPSRYFNDAPSDLTIDFSLFVKSKKKLEQAQEKITTHLDEIELCLFNQVTSRFDEFISVLMTIDSLNILAQDNIGKLAKIRKNQQNMYQNLVLKANNVTRIQAKLERMQKLHQLYSKIHLIRTAKETIKNNIVRDKTSCSALIDTLKQNAQSMHVLSCMADYDDMVEECQHIIKKDLTQSFTEDIFNYVTNVEYSSDFWLRMAMYPDLVVNEKLDLTNATMFLDEELLLEDKNPFNPSTEQAILDIVVASWKNSELSINPATNRLQQFINKQHVRFINDMLQFCKQTLKEREVKTSFEPSDMLSKMSLSFFIKAIQFNMSTSMKYLKRLLSTCKPIINYLLASNDEPAKQLSLVESIFSLVTTVCKTAVDKSVQLINMRKIQTDADYYKFRNYMGLFDNWQYFFQSEIVNLVKYTIPTDCPFKDRVYVLKNKINCHSVTSVKVEVTSDFISRIHKNNMDSLKKAMEDDTWQIVDIPTDFYDPIGYLITGDTWNNRKNAQSTVLESSLFFDRKKDKSSLDNSSIKFDEIELNVKIVKNECVVDGKTYKLSQSFLLFIKTIQKYVRIGDAYPQVHDDVGQKLCQLGRFYNSYSCQLIVGAGAVMLGKIKTKNITARHLCICSLCLEMLVMLFKKVNERIKMLELPKLLEAIMNHHNEIIKKLKIILAARIQSALEEIDLQHVPCKGTVGIVTSTRTLYEIAEDYLTDDNIRRIFDSDIFELYIEHMSKLQVKEIPKAEIFKEDINYYFNELKFLEKVVPEYWTTRQASDALIVKVFEAL